MTMRTKNGSSKHWSKNRITLITIFVLLLIVSLIMHPPINSAPPIVVTFGSDFTLLNLAETGETIGETVGIPTIRSIASGVFAVVDGWLILAHVNKFTHEFTKETDLIHYVNEDGVGITVDPTPVISGPISITSNEKTGHQEHPIEIYQIILDFRMRMDDPFTRRTSVKI